MSYAVGVWDHPRNRGDHGAANFVLSSVGFVSPDRYWHGALLKRRDAHPLRRLYSKEHRQPCSSPAGKSPGLRQAGLESDQTDPATLGGCWPRGSKLALSRPERPAVSGDAQKCLAGLNAPGSYSGQVRGARSAAVRAALQRLIIYVMYSCALPSGGGLMNGCLSGLLRPPGCRSRPQWPDWLGSGAGSAGC